jgi:aminopeptidase
MRDARMDILAGVLVGHCTNVRPGELVTIVAEPSCMSAVEAVYAAVLRAGGHPSFHAKAEALAELLARLGTDDQLAHVCPFERHRLATCDVLMVLRHSVNTNYLGGVDPARVAKVQAARRELLSMSMRRAAQGAMRYTLTEIPGHAAAQEAGMSLAAYEDWVCRAGFLHLPDPLRAWAKLQEQQQRAIEYLCGVRELRFRTPACNGANGSRPHEGTDLTVDVAGRTWVNCAGGENFPDGEIFTGPRDANGVVNFTFPAVYAGQEVEGVRLKFRDGKVVEASAARNEAFLISMLDQDPGARVMGEIAMGTNAEITGFTKNAFFDEKIGGTFHLAVGAGYPETGNTNESGLHWDMVCDLRPGADGGGTIHADGQVISRDGKFTHEGWPGA